MNTRLWFPSFCLATLVVVTPQSAQAQTTQITGVQLETTDAGVQVVLITSSSQELQTFQTRNGNSLVIDLPNTQLNLPGDESFRQLNPAPGLASVEVVQITSNSVRINLTGETEAPQASIQASEQGLTLAVISPVATAEGPTEPAPPLDTDPSLEPEPIELIVTATRTEEEATDVPRSVTVIDREEIEQQSILSNNLGDILGKTLPGFAPPNQSINVRTQSLRGREFVVLIDGVPQSSNQGFASPLATIDPSAVERIEVVRGPTAIYGGNAAGGVINIITRRPTDQFFSATTKLGVEGSLSNLEGDSIGYTLQQTLTGDLGDVDYNLTASFKDIGAFFDAEGDRVPKSAFSDFASLLSESKTFNILGKVGWDISSEQRLQFTVNRFSLRNNSNFVGDTNISEEEKARAVEVKGGLNFEEEPGTSNTVLNLSYNHEDLLGSEVNAQLFYRNVNTRSGSGSLSLPDQEIGFPVAFQTTNDRERWGGRLGIETPLIQENKLKLLWGVDYDEQGDIKQDINLLEDTDEGPGINFEVVSVPTAGQTPVGKIASFGAFAELAWEVTEDWNLRGGLRFEHITVANNDFRPVDTGALIFEGSRDPEEFLGELIPASERSFTDTVFNIGTTVDVTNNLNVFANFAQAFQIPDFRRALRGGLSVSEDIDRLEPQVIDQYELGVRGNWDTVQASISGFYTYSDLGIALERVSVEGRPLPILRQLRAPKRTWGIEAQVDWQPMDNWRLGSSFTWVEGEIDRNNDGNFIRLGLNDIQPMKVITYLENQTTPDWRNRLQMLWVGGREVDNDLATFDTDSYFVVDLISSINVGPGQLQIGLENLLNNQYLVPDRQIEDNDAFGVRAAAPGTRLTINYSFTW